MPAPTKAAALEEGAAGRLSFIELFVESSVSVSGAGFAVVENQLIPVADHLAAIAVMLLAVPDPQMRPARICPPQTSRRRHLSISGRG